MILGIIPEQGGIVKAIFGVMFKVNGRGGPYIVYFLLSLWGVHKTMFMVFLPIMRACMQRRIVSFVVLLAFLLTGVIGPVAFALAQEVILLPQPGTRVNLSPGFAPALLKGLKIYPNDPFRLDFILDKGDTDGSVNKLQDASSRLIRYFLASITVPEKDLWVNLSPYEKDRIAPDAFGQTEMGRDLLAQDYILKQITASLIYPEGEAGKKFWAKVYAEAQARYGTTDIPIDTFNKVWIVPEKAVVYETLNAAYVVESRLKVMLESDYVAVEKSSRASVPLLPAPAATWGETERGGDIAKNILREVIIPILEKEVNEGQNFTQLRQVYNSLILAIWFKDRIRESILGKAYVDRDKIAGIDIKDKAEKDKIWARYVESFKKGAYNFIREEKDTASGEMVPKKHFSGGNDFSQCRRIAVMYNRETHRGRPMDIGISGKTMVVKVGIYPNALNQDLLINNGLDSSQNIDQSVQSWQGMVAAYNEELLNIPGVSFQEAAVLETQSFTIDSFIRVDSTKFGMSQHILMAILLDKNNGVAGFSSISLNMHDIKKIAGQIRWIHENRLRALNFYANKWHAQGFEMVKRGRQLIDLQAAIRKYSDASESFRWMGNVHDRQRVSAITIILQQALERLSQLKDTAPMPVWDKFDKKQAVLVLGASGFIGRNLVRALIKEGYEDIIGIGRSDNFDKGTVSHHVIEGELAQVNMNKPFKYYSLDLALTNDIPLIMEEHNIKYVINVSPYGDVKFFDKYPFSAINSSLGEGLMAILTICRKKGIPLIQMGTALVYDSNINLINEDSPMRPLHKTYTEVMCLREFLSDNYFAVGTKNLRLTNVYGEGDQPDRVIPYFIDQIKKGNALRVVNDVKDFIHVDDVVRAIIAAFSVNVKNGTYNIGTGHGVGISDLAVIVMQLMGKNVPVSLLSETSQNILVLDSSKFSRLSGWSPQVSLFAGLQQKISFYNAGKTKEIPSESIKPKDQAGEEGGFQDAPDFAETVENISEKPGTGGIDLTRGRMNVDINTHGPGVHYAFDPAMIQRLEDATGMTPTIIDIRPMGVPLDAFMGSQEGPGMKHPGM